MAFVPQLVPQVEVLSPARSPTPRSDIDNESVTPPRDADSISIDSARSIPDWTGRKMITFDDERTTTAYEAWEVVSIEDTFTRQSWKSFWGVNLVTRWMNLNDGCVLINPLISFDQGELADLHEDAIRRHNNHNHNGGTTSQETAYEQDLANRAYDLPRDIYDKIQHLLEDKTRSTNQNPYRQREWRVVVLRPGEFRMTELLPERKRGGILPWKKQQPPATRTWFIVIRGQEVKSTKGDGGWRAFNRHSNPWWRLDNRQTKEGRDEHKDVMKKMDRARNRNRRPPIHSRPQPPPPIAPILPLPRPPMSR
ncbi:hypothetical protein F5Y14DRAFT_145307 [Nemania sp. NC0429]|nr:hypothetical protein F5Y14DRAFT_145307 [Nemania sp. NC0429]